MSLWISLKPCLSVWEGYSVCGGGSTVRHADYAPFTALSHPFTTLEVAKLYIDIIYKLQGLPLGIVSDRADIDWFSLARNLQADGNTASSVDSI